MDEQLLTVNEVAEHLGVSASTVHRLADAGRLPVHVKLPGRTGHRLFRAADVEAFDEAHEATA